MPFRAPDTGNTALHMAAALGHRAMVKRLLEHHDSHVTILSVPLAMIHSRWLEWGPKASKACGANPYCLWVCKLPG